MDGLDGLVEEVLGCGVRRPNQSDTVIVNAVNERNKSERNKMVSRGQEGMQKEERIKKARMYS